MNSRIWCRVALAFAALSTNSCTLSEPRIKPEPVLYIPNAPNLTSTGQKVPVENRLPTSVSCVSACKKSLA